jgi:hypothetical protein
VCAADAEITPVTAHEKQRSAALHEYRLLDAAGDELLAVVRAPAVVGGMSCAARTTPPGYLTGSHGVFYSEPREIFHSEPRRCRTVATPGSGATVEFTLAT